jgi:ketosteroid isomerase-like protein
VPPAPSAVQLVEEAYRAWNAGGPRAFIAFTTDDVEVRDAPELPDAGEWVGHDAVVGRLEDVVASTGGSWADIEEVRHVGGEVLVSLTWRMERSSAATLARVYHAVSVHGERIRRVRVFLDEEAAVQAAESG